MADLGALLKLINEEGRCREVSVGVFFPDTYSEANTRQAKRICSKCDVRTACGLYALESRQEYGVWAGKTPNERKVAWILLDAVGASPSELRAMALGTDEVPEDDGRLVDGTDTLPDLDYPFAAEC